MNRETISAQNIDFRDVAINKTSDFEREEVTGDSATNFGDVEDDKEDEIDRDDEKDDETGKVNDFDSKTDETTDC